MDKARLSELQRRSDELLRVRALARLVAVPADGLRLVNLSRVYHLSSPPPPQGLDDLKPATQAVGKSIKDNLDDVVGTR